MDCWNRCQAVQGVIHHSEFFKSIKMSQTTKDKQKALVVSPQFLQNFSKPEYPSFKSSNSDFVVFTIIDYLGYNIMK